MERISGPYKGHFIAAYTVPNGGGFVGYAKICAAPPNSVWSTGPVEKLAAATGCRSELEAVIAAERKARQQIANMLDSPASSSDFGALN